MRGAAIPENREMKKIIFSFFRQRQALSTFLQSPMEWLTCCQNTWTCCYFLWKKTEFPFFEFPYMWVLPVGFGVSAPFQFVLGCTLLTPNFSWLAGQPHWVRALCCEMHPCCTPRLLPYPIPLSNPRREPHPYLTITLPPSLQFTSISSWEQTRVLESRQTPTSTCCTARRKSTTIPLAFVPYSEARSNVQLST